MEKIIYSQTSPNLTFLLLFSDAVSSGLKRRETFRHIISVQFKTSISDGMGVHKCIRYGQLACFGRHYECWKVYKGFRVTYAPLQGTSISGKALCISAGQCKPHTAAITTAWLRSRRVQVLIWPACSPHLSPIENIWCIVKWKIRQRRPQTLQQLETYHVRMGPNSNQNSRNITHNLDFKLFWTEEEMLHHGKRAPVSTILRSEAGIEFEMSSFCV